MAEEMAQGILLALFDYEGRIKDTLKFKKGDQFRFLEKDSRNADWWLVKRFAQQERGLVPANYVARLGSIEAHECFHQGVTRDKAEQKLSEPNLKLGTFLLRKQKAGTGLVLSIRQSKRRKKIVSIQHYVINTNKRNDMTLYFIFHEDKACSSIEQLLEKRQKKKGDLPLTLGDFLPQTAPDLPVAPFDDIDLQDNVTYTAEAGSFIKVTQGKLKISGADPRDIILKKCHAIHKIQELVNLRHNNVIQIYGYYDCHYTSKTFAVMDYLATTLEADIPRMAQSDDSMTIFLERACQIARGMRYLAMNNILHGRLAARNIFLTSHGGIKISDFGILNGECYKEDPSYDFVQWTAVELFTNGRYTIKSDVWSFGMVLYEMMSGGQHPYAEIKSPMAVISAIKGNTLPPKPEHCSLGIFGDMQRCWSRIPEERPDFPELEATFASYTEESGYTPLPVLPGIPSHDQLHRQSGSEAGATSSVASESVAPVDDTSIWSTATFPVIVTALYSYDACEQDELSFDLEDDMTVLRSAGPHWLFAEHKTTMKRGFIPSNYVGQKDGTDGYDYLPLSGSSTGNQVKDADQCEELEESSSEDEDPYGELEESSSEEVDIGEFPIDKINSNSLTDWLQAIEPLNHDNLLSKYSVDRRQGICYFTMTVLTSAMDLSTFLEKNQYQPLQQYEHAIQIAQGMAYLYEASIIHGDLQASSIWVNPGNVIKIGKVGIMSTLEYAVFEWPKSAPEVRMTEELGKKSDVWSYGVLLAEMFSRGVIPESRAFSFETSDEPVFQQQDHWPDEIYDIMKRCMQHRPRDRPLFSDIVVELKNVRQKLLLPTPPPMPVAVEVADLRKQVANLRERVESLEKLETDLREKVESLEQLVRVHDRLLANLTKPESAEDVCVDY